MVVSSPREDETPPRGPQTGSPIHDHCTPTVDNSPHTSEVGMKSFTPYQQHSDQLTLSLNYGRTNCPIF